MKNSLTAELQRTQRADVLFYPAVRGNRIKGSLSASGRGLHKAIPSKRRRPSPWPDGILADYARLVELLMESGPNLRMPHSRAMGGGLFELRPRGREGIGRAFETTFYETIKCDLLTFYESINHDRTVTEPKITNRTERRARLGIQEFGQQI